SAPGQPEVGPGDAVPEPEGASGGRSTPAAMQSVITRYHSTRRRIDKSAAGHLQRRVVEIDLMNQAMILAAMAFMLFIPALVSLLAVIPLGAAGGAAASIASRLGLSD